MLTEAEKLLEAIKANKENSFGLTLKASSKVQMTSEECKKLCSKIGLTYKDGFEDRVIQFRFTDATPDRHNEVVLPEGVDLKAFKKDPNILLQHNSWNFPIGKSLETVFDKEHNDIVGKVLFFDDEIDRSGMSEDTFQMVKNGAVKTGSIGFRAKSEDVRLASPDEIKKYKLDKFGIIFDKIELREFSIVTIPANPNATQIAARKGMYSEKSLETLKGKGATEEEITALSPEKEVATGMRIDVEIDKDASAEERQEKLAFASKLNAEGHDVHVKLFTTPEVKNETIIVDKAGAVLSKKNKKIIQGALDAGSALNSALSDLLNATDTAGKEETETDPVQNDSDREEDETKTDLYTALELGEKQLKGE